MRPCFAITTVEIARLNDKHETSYWCVGTHGYQIKSLIHMNDYLHNAETWMHSRSFLLFKIFEFIKIKFNNGTVFSRAKLSLKNIA